MIDQYKSSKITSYREVASEREDANAEIEAAAGETMLWKHIYSFYYFVIIQLYYVTKQKNKIKKIINVYLSIPIS